MNILAVDQARHGAWSVFNYESKELLKYGEFAFEAKDYPYEKVIVEIEKMVLALIQENHVGAVFFENIQAQGNLNAYKKLAWLQGVLIAMCEKNGFQYDIISPSQWQNHYTVDGMTMNEFKKTLSSEEKAGKRASKLFSVRAVKEWYGVETTNDDLADAILICGFAANKRKVTTL